LGLVVNFVFCSDSDAIYLARAGAGPLPAVKIFVFG